MIPKKIFFTGGVGRHRGRLQSFEMALRDAGIEKCNLVTVSSVFPPGCGIISREEGVSQLRPGEITFCVMARNSSDEEGKRVSSAVGLAFPEDGGVHGYLSEYCGVGVGEDASGVCARDMAAEMLADNIGLEFSRGNAFDEGGQVYRVGEWVLRSHSIARSAVCDAGVWTTVVAAAVFLLD